MGKASQVQVLKITYLNLTIIFSRAISTYFVSSYGLDDSLYPLHPRKRALVDHMLQFDLGTLYPKVTDYYVS